MLESAWQMLTGAASDDIRLAFERTNKKSSLFGCLGSEN